MGERKDINLGEVRKRYQPLREKTEQILQESGITEGPEFRKARKKFTREAYMAGIDEVTRLPIRSLFEIRLQEELSRSERNGKPLTMALIDFNLLKKINEKGLPEGDKALRAVAEKILGSIRRTDYAARYGGDEFAVLLPGLETEDINAWWERFSVGMQTIPYTVTASAMNINRENLDAARVALSDNVKQAKDQNGHTTNAFLMAA